MTEQYWDDQVDEVQVDEPQVDEPQVDERPASSADPRIAAAVERLDGLADTPPAEHVEVYEDVHRVLQESLAEAQTDQADQADR